MQPCYPATQFQRSRVIGFFVFGLPRGFRASGAAKAFARAYLAIGVKICGPRTQRSRSNSFSEKCPRCEIRRIAEEALSEHCVSSAQAAIRPARITADIRIDASATSSRQFRSCFRVLLNASRVNTTASRGSSVNREAKL